MKIGKFVIISEDELDEFYRKMMHHMRSAAIISCEKATRDCLGKYYGLNIGSSSEDCDERLKHIFKLAENEYDALKLYKC